MSIRLSAMWTAVLLISISVSTLAAEKTWTGKISDSHCGASHKKAMVDKHAKDMKTSDAQQGKVDDRACTELCVKDGAKYVFVSKGKVYELSNQDFSGLQEHAGHTVQLTGNMTGKSIQVSNVMMPEHGASSVHKGEKDPPKK